MAMTVGGYYRGNGVPAMPSAPALPPVPTFPGAPRVTAMGATAPVTNPTTYVPVKSGADTYMSVVSAITPFTAGVAPGFKVAREVGHVHQAAAAMRGNSARAVRLRAGAVSSAGEMIGASMWSAVKASLLVKGLSSLATNAYKVYKGEETKADGGANVVGDLVSAGVGGVAAGLASGIASSLLVGVMGPGIMLMVAGALAGAGAYFVADGLLKQTSFYNQLKLTVHNALQ